MIETEEEKYSNSDSRDRSLMSINGSYASIEGNFEISESIDVDCEIKGSMTIDGRITILKEGYVNADIKTRDAEILGKYEGTLEASGIVEIKETGLVNGSIKTDSLIINQGGIFSGNVERITKPDKNSPVDNKMELVEDEEEESEGNKVKAEESEEGMLI
jgi:cytoskeletal protein CcmA (bactofilin family)